jgi:hypothetical protein
LRKYRLDRSLSLEEAANAVSYHPGSLGRAEAAKAAPHPAIVRALLAHYGETDPEVVERFATLAKQARKRGWWQQYADILTVSYVGLEAAAAKIHTHENQLVPGLLQTEDYIRTLIAEERPGATEQETERRVAARLERQEILTRDEAAPEFWAVIDEAALRRPVGGPKVMAAQLRQIVERARLRNMTLQVMPFSAGAHGCMGNRFVILRFAEPADPGVVYLENPPNNDTFVEEPAHIQWYTVAFEHLRAKAAAPDLSVDMIATAADAYDRE